MLVILIDRVVKAEKEDNRHRLVNSLKIKLEGQRKCLQDCEVKYKAPRTAILDDDADVLARGYAP